MAGDVLLLPAGSPAGPRRPPSDRGDCELLHSFAVGTGNYCPAPAEGSGHNVPSN